MSNETLMELIESRIKRFEETKSERQKIQETYMKAVALNEQQYAKLEADKKRKMEALEEAERNAVPPTSLLKQVAQARDLPVLKEMENDEFVPIPEIDHDLGEM